MFSRLVNLVSSKSAQVSHLSSKEADMVTQEVEIRHNNRLMLLILVPICAAITSCLGAFSGTTGYSILNDGAGWKVANLTNADFTSDMAVGKPLVTIFATICALLARCCVGKIKIPKILAGPVFVGTGALSGMMGVAALNTNNKNAETVGFAAAAGALGNTMLLITGGGSALITNFLRGKYAQRKAGDVLPIEVEMQKDPQPADKKFLGMTIV